MLLRVTKENAFQPALHASGNSTDRYSVEPMGTSCSLDWTQTDDSYIFYVLAVCTLAFFLPIGMSFFCLMGGVPLALDPQEKHKRRVLYVCA